MPTPTRILIRPDVPPVLRSALLERHDCMLATDLTEATAPEIGVVATTATLGADDALIAVADLWRSERGTERLAGADARLEWTTADAAA